MHKMKIVTLAAVSILGVGVIGGAAVKARATTTPVKSTAPAAVSTATADNEATGLPDTDNVQQGDQTSPDAATLTSSQTAAGSEQAAETSTEASSEKASAESDGPGGHADPAGNVNHSFQGEE